MHETSSLTPFPVDVKKIGLGLAVKLDRVARCRSASEDDDCSRNATTDRCHNSVLRRITGAGQLARMRFKKHSYHQFQL